MDMRYLLIGGGRLATHLAHYLPAQGGDVVRWRRADGAAALAERVRDASHVLLAITDAAIADLAAAHANAFAGKTLVHFSGALTVEGIAGAHPLMTFGPALYDLAAYEAIPFVTEAEGPAFDDLFPMLPNPSHAIPRAKKPLYHALCVASGNFTQLLWREALRRFSSELGLPREALAPYMAQVFANLAADPENALTGPIARGDAETIAKNLAALDGDALKDVYDAFLKLAADA